MIKHRPSEVIPRFKKKKNFAYVNKQPRLQKKTFSPTEEARVSKQKNKKFNPKTEKADVCSKVAITYRSGFWTSKGGKQSPSSEEE